jgi:hypothetical protein
MRRAVCLGRTLTEWLARPKLPHEHIFNEDLLVFENEIVSKARACVDIDHRLLCPLE